jgi:TRAP-type transport system small permease protein
VRGRVIDRINYSVDKVYGVSGWISRWLEWFGAGAGVVMLVITFTDVVSYKLLSWPILGAYDLVRFTLLISMAFLGSITLINGKHLSVEILVSKFPRRAQGAIEVVMSVLALVVAVMVVWYSILYGLDLRISNEISETTRLPLYPLAFVVAAGFIPIALIFFTKIVRAILGLRLAAK